MASTNTVFCRKWRRKIRLMTCFELTDQEPRKMGGGLILPPSQACLRCEHFVRTNLDRGPGFSLAEFLGMKEESDDDRQESL